jgi:putative FmdB family regulatory protein
MPTYTFDCSTCTHSFEYFMFMSDYDAVAPTLKCPLCDEPALRNFEADLPRANVIVSDNETTVGTLAKRNRDRFSDDYKHELHEKHNAYRKLPKDQEPAPLPKGWKRLRDRDGNLDLPKEQRKVDPKKAEHRKMAIKARKEYKNAQRRK